MANEEISTHLDLASMLWPSEALLAAELDERGIIVWANRSVHESSGRPLAGIPLTSLAPLEQRDAIRASLARASEEWSSVRVGLFPDERGIPRDHWLWLRKKGDRMIAVAEPLFEDVAALTASLITLNEELVTATRELTALQAKEHSALVALQSAHEARWRESLLDRVPVGFAFLDRELRYLKVNDALAAMNGMPAKEHLGKKVGDVVPDLAAEAIASFRRVLETGEPIVDLELAGETPAEPGVERSWRETVYRVDDDDGAPLGVGVLVVETTQQVRLERERAAAEARTATLYETTASLSAAASAEDVARVVVESVVEGLGASAGALHVLNEAGTTFELVYAQGWSQPVRERWQEFSRHDSPAAEAVLLGEPIIVGSSWEAAERSPTLASTRVCPSEHAAWALVPLVGREGVLGVVGMSFLEPRRFDGHDRELAVALAAQGAQALERATLFERQRTVAEGLQRSILPAALPTLEGVKLVARYIPGAAGLAVGGDWYDAFALPSGRLGLVIGDVVGKGVPAAAAMGRLRHMLRAFALENDEPVSVLTRLDLLPGDDSERNFATAVYATLDPVSRELRYASAGHPPPLLARVDGSTVFLDEHSSIPLGIGSGERPPHATVRLIEGDALVLYTDGIIERRGASIDTGMSALADTVREHFRVPLHVLVDTTVTRLSDGSVVDDIAVMALRVGPDPPPSTRSGA